MNELSFTNLPTNPLPIFAIGMVSLLLLALLIREIILWIEDKKLRKSRR